MKLLPFLLLLPVVVFAGMDAVPLYEDLVLTNSTQQTQDIQMVTGKPVSWSLAITADGTGTVSLATVDGRGSSISGAKTLIAATEFTADFTTNFSATTYLYEDTLRLTTSNSCTTNMYFKSLLILDTDP
jgi:hypothetical protein